MRLIQFCRTHIVHARVLLALTVPILLANMIQMANTLIDAFWLGKLSEQAVADVALAFPLIFLASSFGIGISIATTSTIARDVKVNDSAREQTTEAQMSLRPSLYLALAMGAVMTLLLGWPTETLLSSIVLGKSVSAGSIVFTRIMAFSFITSYITMVVAAALRAREIHFQSTLLAVASLVLNAILDPIFIFGYGPIPALGIAGSALATVLATVGSALLALFYIRKYFSSKHSRALSLLESKKLVILSFLGGSEMFVRSLGAMILGFSAYRYGSEALGGYGSANNIMMILVMVTVSLGVALSIKVGQSLGAQNRPLARAYVTTATILSVVIFAIIGSLLGLYADHVMGLFLPAGSATHLYASAALALGALGTIPLALTVVLSGALRAYQRMGIVFGITVLSLLVLNPLLIYIGEHYFSLSLVSVYIASPLSWCVSAIVSACAVYMVIYKKTT